MTRKSIANQVDQIINAVAKAHGHDITDRKGIDPIVHLVHGKVYEAFDRLTAQIVAATQPPVTA